MDSLFYWMMIPLASISYIVYLEVELQYVVTTKLNLIVWMEILNTDVFEFWNVTLCKQYVELSVNVSDMAYDNYVTIKAKLESGVKPP